MSTEGKTLVMKERLNKSGNCFEIFFSEEIIFYKGILLGTETFLELREDMLLDISSLSVGSINIVLLLLFER